MTATVALDNVSFDAAAAAVSKKVRKPRAKKVVAKVATDKKAVSGARALRTTVQKYAFYGILVGVVILTALSLSHLALGISLVIGHVAPNWQDWAFALIFDGVMIVTKSAVLFSRKNDFNKDVFFYGNIFVIIALAGSGALNSLAFAQDAHGTMVYAAIAFGITIPAGIYALTKVAAGLFMDFAR